MAPNMSMRNSEGGGKKKPHRRSRFGCRNCKLRRVKCDETKPRCNNCISILVACNYGPSTSDRDLAPTNHEHIFSLHSPVRTIILTRKATLAASNEALKEGYQSIGSFKSCGAMTLNMKDLDYLTRWQSRTVLTIGTPETALIYQREMLELAHSHPYLMHAVLATTAMHDRHLHHPGSTSVTAFECHHQSRSAALFNTKLSFPIRPADRNAIWCTSVLLSHAAFFSISTTSPSHSWPLVPVAPSHFEWLKLQRGMCIMWKLTSPISSGGIFHALSQKPAHHYLKTKVDISIKPGIDGLPASLISLCNLTPESTVENNPYHCAVRVLTTLMDTPPESPNAAKFLAFVALMRAEFEELLWGGDARALLLMAMWYARICDSHWFIRTRAVVECTAICMFLERNHAHDGKIMELLGELKREYAWIKTDRGGLADEG